jgi:hypothetical protein
LIADRGKSLSTQSVLKYFPPKEIDDDDLEYGKNPRIAILID